MLPADPAVWCKRYVNCHKIVHDNLWGTILLHPVEVALLDTPLLQRLRRIHQTGAVYFTYPSARHSRFEHSLGVLAQASSLLDALQAKNPKLMHEHFKEEIRCAALLHDTGHGPFSHTSEQFFSQYSVFGAAREELGLAESGAGEVMSYLIITCQAMRDFFTAAKLHLEVDISCDEMGKYVTGSVAAEDFYKSEIVHGPFDADKLDYMKRDSAFTGLSINIDIDRLHYSAEIREHQGKKRIGGSSAGIAPLTQIMFNKMQLFMSVYHHHKVRAVDCMLWALFDQSSRGSESGVVLGGVEMSTPWSWLQVTDDRILIPELATTDEQRGLINDLLERRLWKRALMVGRRTVPRDQHESAEKNSTAPLLLLMSLSGNKPEKIAQRRDLARDIWKTAGRPCKEFEVWLDVPKSPDMDEADRMWVLPGAGSDPDKLGDHIPIDKWVDLYGIHRSAAHVFCPEHCRVEIAGAARDVLQKRFCLTVDDRSDKLCKLES